MEWVRRRGERGKELEYRKSDEGKDHAGGKKKWRNNIREMEGRKEGL